MTGNRPWFPVLLRTIYAEDPAFRDVGTVFTIHNMGYQGLFPPEILPLLMLPWDLFTMSKMEFFGQVNFLKGALTYSDYITTVSKKYSQEIQTAEYGFGLEGVLRDRAATVTGILNGVDYDEWSPQTDKFAVAKYSPQDLCGQSQSASRICWPLLASHNADPKLPVIGIVSRFAAQKGFDLIAQICRPPRARRDDHRRARRRRQGVRRNVSAASTSSSPTRLRSRSPMTTPSRTRSRPAPTCS